MSERRPDASLEKILAGVEKPGRYTGGEWNEIRKDPARARVKVVLAFPDVYEIGMSYLGQKILYSLINAYPEYLAERVFSPWPDYERELRASGLRLRSLENKIPLAEFNIVGFSLLYELNYSNILTILDLGGIPLLAAERDIQSPLVIGGGPAAFNPEPLAEFFDLFLVGDGEEAVPEIIETYAALRSQTASKEKILRELARLRGVYVPSLYEPEVSPRSPLLAVKPRAGAPGAVEKRVLRSFSRSHFPEEIIVSNIQSVFDRVAVEVARGCPHKCRFCQATSLYSPYRVKDPSTVTEKIFRSLRATGYEDASLFSLSVGDYPYLGETVRTLMERLEKERISLSLSSLRPKGLSADIVRNIIKVRKTGFTLVPEAGSERLRCVINKNLKDEDIQEAAAHAFREGWKLLKLYFMIGLPSETEDDLRQIADLIERLTALGRGILKSPPKINAGVSSFIPKPHTPFQWLAMDDEETLVDKQRFLKSLLGRKRNVQIKDHPVELSILEAVFSRGDRRLGRVLRNAWVRGARFDSWQDCFQLTSWRKAFEESGVDHRSYLGEIDRNAPLPWGHIQTGIRNEFLLGELKKALAEARTPSCLENSCGKCGGCVFPADMERNFKERIDVAPLQRTPLGQATETTIKYQAFYAKRGPSRMISHNDLINAIQRSFRRAQIEVLYSEGFHPKMQMSLVPALPLGMEAGDESFEFKSLYLFEESEFLARVNEFTPPGIRFCGLKRIEPGAPSLNERISSFVYSLDLGSERVRAALENARKERNLPGDDEDAAALLVEGYLESRPELVEEVSVLKGEKMVLLRLSHSPQKPLRPQDVVEKIFGLPSAVYDMCREKILLRP